MGTEKYLQEWHGEHKSVRYEIINWTMDGCGITKDVGVWNSYILIERRKLQEKIFKKFNLRGKEFKLFPTSPKRMTYDYGKLSDYFDMSGGITFYGKEYSNEGKLYAIKVGNDYQHIWNTGKEDLDSVRKDIHASIDKFLEQITLLP